MSEPKGFAAWTPNSLYKELLPEAQDVIERGRDNWPLTQRYWLYRLMSKYGWIKTNKLKKRDGTTVEMGARHPDYNPRCEASLERILGRGRRAGLIPWDAIAPGRGSVIQPGGYASADELADMVRYLIAHAHGERQAGQARQVALWIETEGMVPLVEDIASDFGAVLVAGKGFDTLTNKYALSKTIAKYGDVLILHVGDLDRSGHTVWTSLEQDLQAFVSAMGGSIEVQRIALLESQVYDYDLPYVAAGPDNGSNHGIGFTSAVECQAEAMEADDLIEIIRYAFEQSLDMELFEERVASEAQMRKDALKLLGAEA